MIHTLTLNPAIDKVYYLPSIKKASMNRVRSYTYTMGGKGTLVAMNLAALGLSCNAFGHFGGKNGRQIVQMLERSGVKACYVPDEPCENRTNIVFVEDDGTCTTVAERGATPSEQSMRRLQALMEETIRPGDSLVISGDASNYPDPNIYERLCRIFSARGVRIYLDSSGETMRRSLQTHPYLIKPNQEELEELAGCKLPGPDSVVEAIERLDREYRIPVIAVSMGSAGAIVKLSSGTLLQAVPPHVPFRNSAGCGDCFLAGLIYGIEQRRSDVEILRWATAYAVAKAESELTCGFTLKRAKEIYPLISMHILTTKGKVKNESVLSGNT